MLLLYQMILLRKNTFLNLRIHDLEYYTNGNVSESRDKSGKLNYLKGNDKLNSST